MTAFKLPQVVVAAISGSHRAATLRQMLSGSTADATFPANCIARTAHSAAW